MIENVVLNQTMITTTTVP